MATLKAMFKLFDGYSSTADKINKKTDEATNKILKASGQTDKFNKSLKDTGASANIASSGLGKFLSVAALIAGVGKGMSIADEYTNTSARLGLITNSLEEQAELQEKIFASADRAKGAYTSMAGAISKMGITAGEAFSSNGVLNTDELVAFTELIQKGFKVGGASTTEQSSAMLQLTQAMGAGKLQGDEFRSIMENAPMIADAIAKYTGKTKGELKELSSDGLITSDIIKNAMFMASDDINDKFETMPMTFADVWNRIKNGGLRAFDGIIGKVNDLINTDGFNQFIDGLIVGFDLLAKGAGWLIDTIINGWGTIGPILGIVAGVLLIAMIVRLWAMVPPLIAQAAAWLAVYWPVLLVIAIIGIAIAAARQFGTSWEDIFGFVGGVIGVFAAAFYNAFVSIWNVVASFVNFFGNVFNSPIASTKALFYDLAATVIGYIATMAKGIEDLLNNIPGIQVDITSGLDGLKSKLEKASATVKSEAELVEFVKAKDFMDFSDGYTKGSGAGKDVSNNLSGAIDGLTDSLTKDKSGANLGDFGTGGNPVAIKGTGKNGKVDVNMADEDLQYLRDIAEREYINKFSTATLAPNVKFEFGDIRETADANVITGKIQKILQEEIALSAEGAY